jgi:ABC-type Fe3+/spermidine/putrescine transport system ATPase subunit
VLLALGADVRVPLAAAREQAGKVSVVVRPDHMALASAAPPSADLNALPGTVKKVSFLGTHLQYAVATPHGEQLTVIEPLSHRERETIVPEVDRQVHVTWPASVSLCFKEGED